MSDGTKIEWTDATWNPITGCSLVSPGCTNCYAMRLAGTRLQHHPSRAGLTDDSKAGPVWTGEVRFNAGWLDQPLRWRRPRRIFVCAHGDLFHESVPDMWINAVFSVMERAPQHSFQVLTKRAERMKNYMRRPGSTRDHPLPNVWLGVSVEDQRRADERIPHLLATPAAVRFVSAEPLLDPVDLRPYMHRVDGNAVDDYCDVCDYRHEGACYGAALDWVIVGGESGPGARPMNPNWARKLRDQCESAGVAFHFKQWGEFRPPETASELAALRDGHAFGGSLMFNGTFGNPYGSAVVRVGKKAAGRILDGRTWDEVPA